MTYIHYTCNKCTMDITRVLQYLTRAHILQVRVIVDHRRCSQYAPPPPRPDPRTDRSWRLRRPSRGEKTRLRRLYLNIIRVQLVRFVRVYVVTAAACVPSYLRCVPIRTESAAVVLFGYNIPLGKVESIRFLFSDTCRSALYTHTHVLKNNAI